MGSSGLAMAGGMGLHEDKTMRDFIGGLVLLALAAGYYLQSLQIPRSTLNDSYGAHGVPQILAACLAPLGMLLAAKALVAMLRKGGVATATAAEAAAGDGKGSASLGRSVLRMLGMLGLGIAYILLLPWIGYPLAIGLMVGAVVLYQGGAARFGLLLTMIGASLGFWGVFVKLLGVPLPAGIWAG